MHIKYKIVEVFPEDHLIVVRFYSDDLTEEKLASQIIDGNIIRCRTDVAITVPIPEPNQEELDKLIMMNCPISFFEIQEKIKDSKVDTSMSTSFSLLNREKETSIEVIKSLMTTPDSEKKSALTADEIQELLLKL
jgi:hypothetical protein